MFDYPIIPHMDVGDPDCCGCLIVRVRSDKAEIVCNECAVVIRTVPVAEVESVMEELARTDTICSAKCPHCGAVNTFAGWSVVEAFVCSLCGEGIHVVVSVQ